MFRALTSEEYQRLENEKYVKKLKPGDIVMVLQDKKKGIEKLEEERKSYNKHLEVEDKKKKKIAKLVRLMKCHFKSLCPSIEENQSLFWIHCVLHSHYLSSNDKDSEQFRRYFSVNKKLIQECVEHESKFSDFLE